MCGLSIAGEQPNRKFNEILVIDIEKMGRHSRGVAVEKSKSGGWGFFDGGQVLKLPCCCCRSNVLFVPDAPVVFCRVCLPWPPCQPKHPCYSVPNRLGSNHVWGAWASYPNQACRAPGFPPSAWTCCSELW